MADHVRIYEVGPRDGLQNEATPVPLEAKLQYIELLVAAGLREIEEAEGHPDGAIWSHRAGVRTAERG